MQHLTLRVAWHDDRWNGTICRRPSENPYCVALDEVRANRDDGLEDSLRTREWNELPHGQLPPCIREAAGFMNPREWTRMMEHPYQHSKQLPDTHGVLRPTPVRVPPFSTLAVPFWWMLKGNQGAVQEPLLEQLPPDEPPPFNTPWVFGKARQEALVEHFFGQLRQSSSLVLFYCKEGQPFGDSLRRLVVGIGTISKIGNVIQYDSETGNTLPMWDRLIGHTIRPGGSAGFLLPYHEYLESTGDPDEDARRFELAREICVAPEPDQIRSFSYVAELANSDVVLGTLVRTLDSVRLVRQHGIAEGPWAEREDWINQQIAEAWRDRGPFPGVGAALEGLGLRLGTALSLDMRATGQVKSDEDPWPLVDAIMRDEKEPPRPEYKADLAAFGPVWNGLTDEQGDLVKLLSRFSISSKQARRWLDQTRRNKATRDPVDDSAILANPYRISETDLGEKDDRPIGISTLDRGLMPADTIAAAHPLEAPSKVDSDLDPRRVRAALVAVLRRSGDDGDTLVSISESLQRLEKLDLARPCVVPTAWLRGSSGILKGVIDIVDIPDPSGGLPLSALQLSDVRLREERLAKILRKRAERELAPVQRDWEKMLLETIGDRFEKDNDRHRAALDEQTAAIHRIMGRKLSVLVGRAGTGKTSILGAILRDESLRTQGVLFLAPTGKARVRLSKATGVEAQTIAQFLYRLRRYDGARQRPLFEGERKHAAHKTIVIDEASMLTMDDLYAVLEALDLSHVERVILVGDPNQLPPIGAGRPFADLVGSLNSTSDSTEEESVHFSGALGKLTVEVRSQAGEPSDTLQLASWFTADPQPADADRILSELGLERTHFNDLEVRFWETHDDLHDTLLEQMVKHLGLQSSTDVEGFNATLGIGPKGWVERDNHDGAENFQVLSPVRMHPYGVRELNRWIQGRFRGKELEAARTKSWVMALGDEEIVVRDKVIQLRNQKREAWDWDNRGVVEEYLANGEIGIVSNSKKGFHNVAFAGRAGLTFGYHGKSFGEMGGPLELAYALTVHKAQGSEFETVFVVLPRFSRLVSRELLYTALTRSRKRMVLLVEGSDVSFLHELSNPQSSETARRNTNLFIGSVRETIEKPRYSEHLIHKADDGMLVRSKSELVIVNKLIAAGVSYRYERALVGGEAPGTIHPDFSFEDAAGDLVVWEHLGMMFKDDYRRGWEWKKKWYESNGYRLGENLFTTQDDSKGGLDSGEIGTVIEKIRQLI